MEFTTHREAKDATLDWLLWYSRSIKDALDAQLPQPSAVRADIDICDGYGGEEICDLDIPRWKF